MRRRSLLQCNRIYHHLIVHQATVSLIIITVRSTNSVVFRPESHSFGKSCVVPVPLQVFWLWAWCLAILEESLEWVLRLWCNTTPASLFGLWYNVTLSKNINWIQAQIPKFGSIQMDYVVMINVSHHLDVAVTQRTSPMLYSRTVDPGVQRVQLLNHTYKNMRLKLRMQYAMLQVLLLW